MCGIAGIVSKGSHVHMPCVTAMHERLKHRGPDDHGFLVYSAGRVHLRREWVEPEQKPDVIFLHRRLSILDLSDAGWQPMGTPDGRYFITFNGEIYNYRELRQELEGWGHRFRSTSDTEVLLAAYAAWGPNALQRLVGMFAFAILDTVRRSVFLARDFFGIKPLYYSVTRDSVVFASELKAILEADGVSRHANANRVLSYLRRGLCDFGGETLFSKISQLPPAHYLEIPLEGDSDPRPVRYWEPVAETRNDLSFEQAAEQLRDLFLKSVAFHLRSDVPVGSALSGGIDSSSVVMAMRYLEPEIDLNTFSYVADDAALNEERWIDIVGRAAGSRMHKVHPTADRLVADFEDLTDVQDIPWGGTSPYAQLWVFEAAQQAGIKVMLDGQGADEILGGYTYFKGARLASLLRQKRWREAADFLSQASRWPGVPRMRLLQDAFDCLLPPQLQKPVRKLIGRDLVPSWLNLPWFLDHGVNPYAIRCRYYSERVLRETVDIELYEHLPSLLRYEDRNSMAFSIESRVPFLTPQLVNFVLSLPEEYIVAADGTSKAVFRRAMRGIVPDAILDRKDKIGFDTPERTWLAAAANWFTGKLDSGAAAEIPAFQVDAVRRDLQQIREGRKRFSAFVWRCLNLTAWTERFQVQYS